ncbi:tRNA threonylcarbamoyladenosine dehydratase [Aquabacterium sp. OR-4]|uniref:tRNA threonylcarbamoyladenosine dehydratase n=1 Tax=Aquabacterium sp. OR-4 TaxID=2978127 RepID=UPI0021B3B19C|nr:tRNA threonylcarbamoyladenosine dehydratase [Aquabacterium sp. OR-4]MDT7836248.1 tRNA threonylcarbamoyladenosine dehydratase [Aquabacterium sp. OR-4]
MAESHTPHEALQPPASQPPALPAGLAADEADLERRFGGLRRLYGEAGYQRVRAARVAVVGLGGVGSWAVEALARSGVAQLVLIDLDQVSESNINRQVQALGSTVGQAKALALQQRIADIHPGCQVWVVEEFAAADNWPGLLPAAVDAVIDACDQGQAKLALAAWSRTSGTPLVVCGAAGGKLQAQAVEVADLADTTHDPLLATLRQRLRKQGAPRQGRIGLRCVFSRESVAPPVDAACASDGSLNCHGYGSTVTVTASFGLVAAGEVIEQLRAGPRGAPKKFASGA